MENRKTHLYNYKSNDFLIIKDLKNKSTKLNVNIDCKWELFYGNSFDTINKLKPILYGNSHGVFNINVPYRSKNYFLLSTNGNTILLTESLLPIYGGHNFRDLGGLKTYDDQYTKWGKIFRADDLSNLTNNDLAFLDSIPLTSIVDFRSLEEISKAPDKTPNSVKKCYTYPMNPGNVMQSQTLDYKTISPSDADSIMINLNKQLVTNKECVKNYKDFFYLLQDNANSPILFHCTAGKDRTGLGAALILYSLGVDKYTIMENYLESNIYLESKYGIYKEKYPNLRPLFEVKPEFLLGAINTIIDQHSSIEDYLTKVLNINIEKMRELYLC